MAPMATFATDLADSDCYSPKANGGLGYCGPSQVCVLVHLPFPRHFEKRCRSISYSPSCPALSPSSRTPALSLSTLSSQQRTICRAAPPTLSYFCTNCCERLRLIFHVPHAPAVAVLQHSRQHRGRVRLLCSVRERRGQRVHCDHRLPGPGWFGFLYCTALLRF